MPYFALALSGSMLATGITLSLTHTLSLPSVVPGPIEGPMGPF